VKTINVKKLLGADWYADRDFWRIYAPYIFGSGRWEACAGEAASAVSLTGARPGSKVMDACCGVGRHSLEFARMGFDVTCVDLNGDYLDAARASFEEESLTARFVCCDILSLDMKQSFDLIVNMYISFGYFDAEEDNLRFLKNLHAHLAAGGRLLVETLGKEHVVRNFRENEWYEEDGVLVLARYALTDDCGRLRNRWMLIDGDSRCDYTFTQRLYSAAELKGLFLRAGFSDARAYGSLKGSAYDHTAEALVVVGTK
jgi:SAM-dependent methyltransferase